MAHFLVYTLLLLLSKSHFCQEDSTSSSPTLAPLYNSSDEYATLEPSVAPSSIPSIAPTDQSSFIPTFEPTFYPTDNPTTAPTWNPTDSPSSYPSIAPTDQPTFEPTFYPTDNPTTAPTDSPSSYPSIAPTDQPTFEPTFYPTSEPTVVPTDQPTYVPTLSPTDIPTAYPTYSPSNIPTYTPTLQPTVYIPKSILVGYVVTNVFSAMNCSGEVASVATLVGVCTTNSCSGLYNNCHSTLITYDNSTAMSSNTSFQVLYYEFSSTDCNPSTVINTSMKSTSYSISCNSDSGRSAFFYEGKDFDDTQFPGLLTYGGVVLRSAPSESICQSNMYPVIRHRTPLYCGSPVPVLFNNLIPLTYVSTLTCDATSVKRTAYNLDASDPYGSCQATPQLSFSFLLDPPCTQVVDPIVNTLNYYNGRCYHVGGVLYDKSAVSLAPTSMVSSSPTSAPVFNTVAVITVQQTFKNANKDYFNTSYASVVLTRTINTILKRPADLSIRIISITDTPAAAAAAAAAAGSNTVVRSFSSHSESDISSSSSIVPRMRSVQATSDITSIIYEIPLLQSMDNQTTLYTQFTTIVNKLKQSTISGQFTVLFRQYASTYSMVGLENVLANIIPIIDSSSFTQIIPSTIAPTNSPAYGATTIIDTISGKDHSNNDSEKIMIEVFSIVTGILVLLVIFFACCYRRKDGGSLPIQEGSAKIIQDHEDVIIGIHDSSIEGSYIVPEHPIYLGTEEDVMETNNTAATAANAGSGRSMLRMASSSPYSSSVFYRHTIEPSHDSIIGPQDTMSSHNSSFDHMQGSQVWGGYRIPSREIAIAVPHTPSPSSSTPPIQRHPINPAALHPGIPSSSSSSSSASSFSAVSLDQVLAQIQQQQQNERQQYMQNFSSFHSDYDNRITLSSSRDSYVSEQMILRVSMESTNTCSSEESTSSSDSSSSTDESIANIFLSTPSLRMNTQSTTDDSTPINTSASS